MATTVASFSAIDDTAIDAESPIVESMMKQLRDNSYWIDAGTRQTTETDTTKALKPDGSGGVVWGTGGINGTKGAGTVSTASGAPTQIPIISGQIMRLYYQMDLVIDSSDDTYIWRGNSGTITGTFVSINGLFTRKNGSNYEFYDSVAYTYSYLWL